MRTVWLVYNNREYYDGGVDPLLVCLGEQDANRAAERINAFARRLRERIDALQVFANEISEEEHARRWDKRRNMLQRARWPFGIKRDECESLDLYAQAMPLPFVREVV